MVYLLCLHVLLPDVLVKLPSLTGSSRPACKHSNSLGVLLVLAEGVQDKQLQLCAEMQLDLLLQLLGALQGCCSLPALNVCQRWQGWLQRYADAMITC